MGRATKIETVPSPLSFKRSNTVHDVSHVMMANDADLTATFLVLIVVGCFIYWTRLLYRAGHGRSYITLLIYG